MFKTCCISGLSHLLLRSVSLFLCLLACVLSRTEAGFCQDVTNSHDAPQTIRGIVVNKLTGEPVSRALVVSGDNRLGALTDGSGRFEFSIPRIEKSRDRATFTFGNHSSFRTYLSGTADHLTAKKPGFVADDADIISQQNGSGLSLTISLLPEAIIHGHIVTSNHEPAERMNVQLFKQEVREGTYHWIPVSSGSGTNSRGEFRFAELRPGAYKVMTQELLDTDPQDLAPNSQLYGFPPVCFPGVADFASGSTIQLTAGQDFQADIPLARQAYFPVRIPVLNSASAQGLNVAVFAGQHPGPGYSLGYNPQTGRIEGLLPNGTYHVEADSYSPTPTSGAIDITVAGTPAQGPSLALLPNGLIAINVHEEFSSEWNGSSQWDGNRGSFELHGPRAYLYLWLEQTDDFLQGPVPVLRSPMSARDESLVIENARPGRYWVHVRSSRGYVQSMTSGNRDLLHEPLVISFGAHTPMEITMRDDSAKIEGLVKQIATDDGNRERLPGNSGESSGEQPPSAYVLCIPLPDGTGQFQESTASGDGTILGMAMAPGSYRVLAFEHRHQNFAYRDPQLMRAYESLGQVVTLSPGQTQHVELQLIADE